MTDKNNLPYWGRAVVFFILYFIFLGIVSVVFYKISFELLFSNEAGKNFLKVVDAALKEPEFSYLLAIQLLLNTLFTLVFLWLFKIAFDKEISDLLTSIKSLDFKSLLKGSLAGLVLICIPTLILWIKGDILFQGIDFQIRSIVFFAVIYLCVGFVEETVNRGYILVQLTKSVGKWPGIVLSSLLFSLIHSFNDPFSLIPLLNLMLGGVMLSMIFLHYNNNLWLVTGIHFSWNFIQGTVLGFNVSGFKSVGILTWENTGDQQWTGGNFGLEGSLITLLMLSVIIIIFVGLALEKKPVAFNNSKHIF